MKREKGPRAGDATQLVDAGIPEAERRPDDQVFHRAGDEDLARSRERHHASARVDPDPADVHGVVDLARVHTRADLDPERTDVLDDPLGSAHCTCGLGERGEGTLACEILLPSALRPSAIRGPHSEAAQKAAPPGVAHLRGHRGRTHDVEEEHGRETTPAPTSRHAVSMPGGARGARPSWRFDRSGRLCDGAVIDRTEGGP